MCQALYALDMVHMALDAGDVFSTFGAQSGSSLTPRCKEIISPVRNRVKLKKQVRSSWVAVYHLSVQRRLMQ